MFETSDHRPADQGPHALNPLEVADAHTRTWVPFSLGMGREVVCVLFQEWRDAPGTCEEQWHQYTTQTLPLFWKTPRHEQAAFQCKEESQLCHKGPTVVATTTIPGIVQLLVQPLLYMMKRIKIYQSTLNDASYLHKITPVSGHMFLQHIWQFEFVVNQ